MFVKKEHYSKLVTVTGHIMTIHYVNNSDNLNPEVNEMLKPCPIITTFNNVSDSTVNKTFLLTESPTMSV